MCALGLAFTLFELSFYVLALALLVSSKASGVVRQALVPRLVLDHNQLVEANSHLARLGAIAGGIAGAVGVWLLSVTSAPVLLQCAAAFFALAALVALQVRTEQVEAAPPSLEYAELHEPLLVGASAGMMALRAGVGYFVFMLAFALRRESEPAWVFGLAVGAYGLGSFSGNVVAPILRRRLSEERLMAGALFAAGVVAAVGVLGINRRTLVLVAFVFGLSATIGRQAFDSLLQRSAPDALRGRTFARYETRFQLTWVLGGVLATAIALPVEVGMAVLTVLFVPVVAIYARGAGEAVRFALPAVSESLAAARGAPRDRRGVVAGRERPPRGRRSVGGGGSRTGVPGGRRSRAAQRDRRRIDVPSRSAPPGRARPELRCVGGRCRSGVGDRVEQPRDHATGAAERIFHLDGPPANVTS